ncbi:MAG: hypothetical protein JXR03_20615 [Cyclobacteriaceae bacterium]
MLKKTILIIFNLSFALLASTQPNIKEQVYIHLNSQQIITGETLYYKAYCNSQMTGRPSLLSKILYLELIGEQGVIHQEKIELENGVGHGDFFVSSLISTGKYQLVAYTRWMKNFNDYSQSSINIINPYEDYEFTHKSSEQELHINFYPSNKNIIEGVENTVAFQVVQESNSIQYKGKIVNDQGETVANFDHNQLGFGKFTFTPSPKVKYQVILEDPQGNFKFFDLPKFSSSGLAINIEEKSSHLGVELVGSADQNKLLKLVALKGYDVQFEIDVAANTSTIIPKSNLGEGMVTLEAQDNQGTTLASRHFLNQKIVLDNQKLSDVYKTRSKVAISPKLLPGRYSVSVKKKDQYLDGAHAHSVLSEINNYHTEVPISAEEYHSSMDMPDWDLFFLASELKNSGTAPDSVKYMPEVREEILSGKISAKDDSQVSEVVLTMSFPSDSYELRTAKTDKSGQFTIPFKSMGSTIDAYLAAQSFDPNLEVTLDNPFLDSYPPFDYELTSLDSIQIVEIVEKSIRNQIENAYYEAPKKKQNTSFWFPPVPYNSIYVLDEYTRFKSIKETFTEYIFTANFRERRDHVIKPVVTDLPYGESYPPLILIDGLPISGDKMIEFSPYKIESISLYNNRYFLGSLIADGVINFKTKEDVLNGFSPDESYTKVEVMKVSRGRNYNFKKHDESEVLSLPDQRDQLFWNPSLTVEEEEESNIEFYTSDIAGEFEVVIEGFTSGGKPITLIRTFQVEKADKI